MFKVGDILKARMTEAELQYEGCKGTVVYNTMMKRAEQWRFEIIADNGSTYTIRRMHDNQQDDKPKGDVHSLLELANDPPPQ